MARSSNRGAATGRKSGGSQSVAGPQSVGPQSVAAVRAAARRALRRILEPLSEFAADAGLGIAEVGSLLREAAVHSAAARQRAAASRINISGIAAATGISRAEVARLLHLGSADRAPGRARREPLTGRVVAAWCAKFSDQHGRPRQLSIFGRGATFEALVKTYGRGIPTRAILDELVRSGVVEMLEPQKLRLKTRAAADRSMTPKAIGALGKRAAEFFAGSVRSVKHPGAAVLLESAANAKFSREAMRVLGEELSAKGEDFFTEVRDSLVRRSVKGAEHPTLGKRAPDGERGGQRRKEFLKTGALKVSIVYHEDSEARRAEKSPAVKTRSNLRRGEATR